MSAAEFVRQLGLLAAVAAVPIVVLYLVSASPREMSLPTLAFLSDEGKRGRQGGWLGRLRRNLLLLVQLLVVALLAVALAGPAVTLPARQATGEAVLVVDASASMATATGGGTRLDAARAAVDGDVADTTTVVAAAETPATVALRTPPQTTRSALADVEVRDVAGDLRSAVRRATTVAGPGARIVVASDFADATDWRTAVRAARARGHEVVLRQVGGRPPNVGITDLRAGGDDVTATVRNFGPERVERTVSLGDATETVTLDAEEGTTVSLPLPSGGGTVRLSPGDAFATDDAAYVGAPADPTVDTLVLTNDPESDRYLLTALRVLDATSVTVAEPPTAVDRRYDLVVFANATPDRVLAGTVEAARATVADGGGVAVLARPGLRDARYAGLSPVETGDTVDVRGVETTARTRLTEGLDFPAPDRAPSGSLRRGETQVASTDGTPLVATASVDGGQQLYVGYLHNASAFPFTYTYPVFWRRATYYLADRAPPDELTRRTGETWNLDGQSRVETPTGTATTASVALAQAGFYATTRQRVGASLLSPTESDVAAPDLDAAGSDDPPIRQSHEVEPVLQELTPLVAGGALAVVLGELAYLRRRGEL